METENKNKLNLSNIHKNLNLDNSVEKTNYKKILLILYSTLDGLIMMLFTTLRDEHINRPKLTEQKTGPAYRLSHQLSHQGVSEQNINSRCVRSGSIKCHGPFLIFEIQLETKNIPFFKYFKKRQKCSARKKLAEADHNCSKIAHFGRVTTNFTRKYFDLPPHNEKGIAPNTHNSWPKKWGQKVTASILALNYDITQREGSLFIK